MWLFVFSAANAFVKLLGGAARLFLHRFSRRKKEDWFPNSCQRSAASRGQLLPNSADISERSLMITLHNCPFLISDLSKPLKTVFPSNSNPWFPVQSFESFRSPNLDLNFDHRTIQCRSDQQRFPETSRLTFS
jgi:hypothetical protein